MGLLGNNKLRIVFDSITVRGLLDILSLMDLSPELQDKSGDPMITFKVEGQPCFVGLCEWDRGGATILQFGATLGIKLPIEFVNNFNSTKRFARAYLHSDGDVILDMDVNLEGGVSRAYLEQMIKAWCKIFVLFCMSIYRAEEDRRGESLISQLDNPLE